MKIKHMELNANNDTAPVDSIALNTPDGVKYLSGESGALQFGGEAIGSGGGKFIVRVIIDGEENVTTDKTHAEILEAYRNGKIVEAVLGAEGNATIFYLTTITNGSVAFHSFLKELEYSFLLITANGNVILKNGAVVLES